MCDLCVMIRKYVCATAYYGCVRRVSRVRPALEQILFLFRSEEDAAGSSQVPHRGPSSDDDGGSHETQAHVIHRILNVVRHGDGNVFPRHQLASDLRGIRPVLVQ